MKKLVTLVLALCLVAIAFNAMAEGKVMLYSSMQEAQIQAVKEAFEAKYAGSRKSFCASPKKTASQNCVRAAQGRGWTLKLRIRSVWTGL